MVVGTEPNGLSSQWVTSLATALLHSQRDLLSGNFEETKKTVWWNVSNTIGAQVINGKQTISPTLLLSKKFPMLSYWRIVKWQDEHTCGRNVHTFSCNHLWDPWHRGWKSSCIYSQSFFQPVARQDLFFFLRRHFQFSFFVLFEPTQVWDG